MSIKKTASLDSDAERKSKKLEGMKIDATSVDSIKNVKGNFKMNVSSIAWISS